MGRLANTELARPIGDILVARLTAADPRHNVIGFRDANSTTDFQNPVAPSAEATPACGVDEHRSLSEGQGDVMRIGQGIHLFIL